jgi:predicted nicotinamide N-methyase
MISSFITEKFRFGEQSVTMALPCIQLLQKQWEQDLPPGGGFPYWAKVWPAALGLCEFITQYPNHVKNKKVLELAAGLGLPSLVTAKYATAVVCSDYAEDSLFYIKQSVLLNQRSNVSVACINWNKLPAGLSFDTVLMSDINYDPAVFPELESLFKKLLEQGRTIILSTPQRLMAKPFITAMMPFCIDQMAMPVAEQDISVFIYKCCKNDTSMMLNLP